MLKSQKTQWLIFISVLMLIILELFYTFFYHPPISKKFPTGIPFPTVAIKKANVVGISSVFNQTSVFQTGEQLRKMVSDAQKKNKNFISYGYFLKALMIGNKICPDEINCFFSSNISEKEWKSGLDKDFPITTSGPFIVKINFNGDQGPSGVNLNGQVSKNNGIWWKGSSNIFFGIGNEGKRLYIDAKNNSSEPTLIFDKVFDKKLGGIYVMFDEAGKYFLVTDLTYNKLVYVDLNEVTKDRFPDGLFPNKEFYVGYSIAPQSNLVIYDFSIL
jgi:hypothetical protein